MDKNVKYIYKIRYHSTLKEGNLAICDNINELEAIMLSEIS